MMTMMTTGGGSLSRHDGMPRRGGGEKKTAQAAPSLLTNCLVGSYGMGVKSHTWFRYVMFFQ